MTLPLSPKAPFFFVFAPNGPFQNSYMVVYAGSEQEARKIMLDAYGCVIWILSFTEDDWLARRSIDKVYTMHEIPFSYMLEEAPWHTDYSIGTYPISYYPTGRTK